VQAVLGGTEPADDDLVMKARGIAINRGVEVE
jgi:DNA-binding protein